MTDYSSPQAKKFFSWFDRVCDAAHQSAVGKVLEPAGWSVYHTGGGCLAWSKDNADNTFEVLITYGADGLGEEITEADLPNETFGVGLYGHDSGWVNPPDDMKLVDAMAWAEEALSDPKAMFIKAEKLGWSYD